MVCWSRSLERVFFPYVSRFRNGQPGTTSLLNVVGWKGLKDPALLYHYAGRGKDFDQILLNFGLQRHKTSDCRRVFTYVDEVANSTACIPGDG